MPGVSVEGVSSRADADRPLDVIVYGATGFVGRLTAQRLSAHAPAAARIGLAGRSRPRLEAIRAELGPAAAAWPLLVADAEDPASLAAMAGAARVVATTVGPYARHGLPLVAACAQAGTHYADLTGEVLFVRDSIDAHHGAAAASGARIAHACGFDSIPSDLGVLLAAGWAAQEGEGTLTETTLLVVTMRGGVSGGTVDSLRNQVDVARNEPSLQRVVADPYALSPDRAAEPDLGDESDAIGPRREPDLGAWTAPFVMGPFNTRIVRRSNALQEWAYGRGFRYREVLGLGDNPASPALAAATAAGLWGATAAMAFPPARVLLDRVLPKPGEGPDERARERGHFRLQVHARTTTGARCLVTVAAKGDPGYAATAVMLAESALCLAFDGDRLPPRAGVLTPATAMGLPLVERLRAAGFTATVERR